MIEKEYECKEVDNYELGQHGVIKIEACGQIEPAYRIEFENGNYVLLFNPRISFYGPKI